MLRLTVHCRRIHWRLLLIGDQRENQIIVRYSFGVNIRFLILELKWEAD